MSDQTDHEDQPPAVAALLTEAIVLTGGIRDAQSEIAHLGGRRREVIHELRKYGVTYRAIASAMGMTEQNVYKIVKG